MHVPPAWNPYDMDTAYARCSDAWPRFRREASMRKVTGRTDRVVIVGAGFAGLACALHLAATGREVTVLEREGVPGGRAGRLCLGGYEFDTGPVVLTMPE